MQITLTDTGKRYNREWIFRHCDFTFHAGQTYAITGPNGSGKSTLLQIIAGAVMSSEGKITYTENSHSSAQKTNDLSEQAYQQISFAAPYLDLIEEMTCSEFLKFHAHYKKMSFPIIDTLQQVGLEKSSNKQIRYFSSGMKQRLKLAQAFLCNTSVLLLDEPTTNLDEDGISLYKNLLEKYTKDRLVIVSSNDSREYEFCKEVISISSYK